MLPGSMSIGSLTTNCTPEYAASAGSASVTWVGETYAAITDSNAAGHSPTHEVGRLIPVAEIRTTEPTWAGENSVPVPLRVWEPEEIVTRPVDSWTVARRGAAACR